jgi:hypothetical protein
MALTLGTLPTLRRGRPVLRRDRRTLQVGIGAHPVLLPDTPPVQALLRAIDPRTPGDPSSVDPTDPDVRRALTALADAGHVSPAPSAEPSCAPSPALGPPATAGRVRLVALGPEVASLVVPALDAAGVSLDPHRPDVVLVVSAGPVSRGVTDPLVQAGLPHLVASAVEGSWRVGPFVVPGLTACLRCVDAHEAAADPRRPLLLEQAARAARDDPEPLDPVASALAVAWAVNDVRAYLAGAEPGTWSTTVDLPPADAATSAPVVTRRLRHPECGCSWDVLLELP